MLRPAPLLALFAILAATGIAGAHGRDPHIRAASQSGWRTDLRAARQEAARVSKPLMVVLRCFD